MKKIFAVMWLLQIAVAGLTQKNAEVQAYIDQYAELAIQEQIRTGVPAAIKLAQAVHESGAGKGDLALRSNNHFGIKCKSNWTGAVAYHDDDAKGECFRAYDSVAFSFRDHSDFLKSSKRYAALFELDPSDFSGWAHGLKQAGYATNPKYPAIIIRTIETYELQQYTAQAIALIQKSTENGTSGANVTGLALPSTSH